MLLWFCYSVYASFNGSHFDLEHIIKTFKPLCAFSSKLADLFDTLNLEVRGQRSRSQWTNMKITL